jgi:hypothetical protein
MNRLSRLTLVVLSCAVPLAWGADHPCEEVVGLLATEFRYKVPILALPRIEIRQCNPNDSATIQLVAWRADSKDPSLLINTDDFGVVQAIARANVFIIETGGATRDQVFVITYVRGEPKLAWKRTTKGSARVVISASAIDVLIDGIYAGAEPPRSESQHFALDETEMRAPQ